jgi:hypothetical protein
MSNRFEDLLATAAEDGASTPTGLYPFRNGAEFEQLMEAWYIERQKSIESSLLLDRVHQLLTRILHDGEVTETSRRKTLDLLHAIKGGRHGPRHRGF